MPKAWAHCVVGSADYQNFIHAHPEEAMAASGIHDHTVGFSPASPLVVAGRTCRPAFSRLDAPTCGGIVHFPAIGLKTILPPGQVTLVEFTLPTSGELSFTCGAGIMHGAVVIRSLELCSWFLG